MDLSLAKKWNSLGVPVIGMYLHQISSNLKFASKVEDLLGVDFDESEEKDYNCLAIFISESNIFCLDINNIGDSIKSFHKYLELNNSKISDFLYEETMNGGLHVFFHNEGFKKNSYHNDSHGIMFDLLCQGRVFTSPTSYGEQKYTFGNKSPMDLKSVDQIGKMPKFIKALVEKSHHSPRIPTPVFL